MKVPGFLFRLGFKTALLISLMSALAVGCSNGSGNNGGTEGANLDPKRTVIDGVSKYEEQLKGFGVHFEVSETTTTERPYSYSYEFVNKTLIEVQLKMTAQDKDLAQLGKSPEDRDQLLIAMSDLWKTVDANNFQNNNTERDLMIAVMKVKIVRTKYMLPKFLALYSDAVNFSKSTDGLSFVRDQDSELSLWQENPSTLVTNANAIGSIEKRLTVNDRFESLKSGFLDQLISMLEDTNRLRYDGTRSNTIAELRSLKNFTFLSTDEIDRLKSFRKRLSAANPNEVMDISSFTELNNAIISQKRNALVAGMEMKVSENMAKLGLRFADENGAVAIDPKSEAQARINGTYTGSPRSEQKDLVAKQTAYEKFITKYGSRSKAPSNETDVLLKIALFNGL